MDCASPSFAATIEALATAMDAETTDPSEALVLIQPILASTQIVLREFSVAVKRKIPAVKSWTQESAAATEKLAQIIADASARIDAAYEKNVSDHAAAFALPADSKFSARDLAAFKMSHATKIKASVNVAIVEVTSVDIAMRANFPAGPRAARRQE